MEPVTYVASTTVSTTESLVPSVGFDIFAFIGSLFGGNEEGVSFFSSDGLLSFFSSFWSVIAILSYIISIILLILYVFAATRRNLYLGLMEQELRDGEELYAQQKWRGVS